MDIGDTVVIIKDSSDRAYEKTDAVIISESLSMFDSIAAQYEVKRWDGTYCYYYETQLQNVKTYYYNPEVNSRKGVNTNIRLPDLPLDPCNIPCEHKQKYINTLSNSLKFWYCPNCRMDWDIKEGE